MFVEYYKYAFPAGTVHRLYARAWEQGGPGADKREYGIETHPAGEYRRWKACETVENLKAFVAHPQFGKLNVGAMFDKCPLERWLCPSGSEPKPVQKEFVIDIDMDDYDQLGISKDQIGECDAAFAIVGVGLEVCMEVLRDTFNFQHILPVYSGRRGAHLWVCDKRACLMDDPTRKSIVDFIKPGHKTHTSGRKTFKWLLQYPTYGGSDNPMQKKGVFSRIIYKFFRFVGVKSRLAGGLGLLDVGFDRTNFLEMIDSRLANDLTVSVRSAANGLEALTLIENTLRDKPPDVKEWLVPRFCEAICTLVWPRVDEAVSTHMNHTLKAPFSVHPKTGRVSVPILGKRYLWSFKPETEAPMAAGDMPDSFRATIELTNAFIDTLAQSSTEAWQPPDLSVFEPPPPAKRYCYSLSSDCIEDCTPVLASTKRIAWVTSRSLSVHVDDDGIAHFELRTHSHANQASVVILPRSFPPFVHERVMGQAKLDHMLESTLSTIAYADSTRNASWHAFSWSQIVIVDPDVSSDAQSLRRANARFERLRERLAEGSAIGHARVAWGEMALSSFIRQKIWPFLDELRSL